jgi:hypothetical protein
MFLKPCKQRETSVGLKRHLLKYIGNLSYAFNLDIRRNILIAMNLSNHAMFEYSNK